jgi:LysM repeat protein
MDVLKMRKARFALLAVATLSLLLAACTRSASASPVAEPTEDPLESIFSTVATQTALAAGDKEGPEDEPTLEVTATAVFGNTATIAPSPTSTPEPSKTPAPITELPVPATYTLHEGEWPYCLARRFNINPDELLAANGLNNSNANSLSVGTKLTIPQNAGRFGGDRSLRPHPATYTATGSDSFYSIACAFGDAWPEYIAEANGLDLDDSIPGGTQLYIP